MCLYQAHIWAADFCSDDECEAIFEEHYNDDETPISRFAHSQNEWFYDHDFFFVDQLTSGIDDLFVGEVSQINRQQIITAWKRQIPQGFNYVIVGNKEDFSSPKTCQIDNNKLIYLGLFDFFSRQNIEDGYVY